MIDNDEVRYPSQLLYKWKLDAERNADLRLEARRPLVLLDSSRLPTEQLLSWPQTLPDGTWLERPELDQIYELLKQPEAQSLVVLGAPGSGKSALLARLGRKLSDDGWNVFGIKADHLPREVSTLKQLREHFGLELPIIQLLYALSKTANTVLILDQLDALSDLVDLHTERLSVLLSLASEAADLEKVRVICSARDFDFRHDIRFGRLRARELQLQLPSLTEVDRALVGAGLEPVRISETLRSLLRTPQWLKVFLRLSFDSSRPLPTNWQSLLEEVWQQKVLRPPECAASNEVAVSSVAKEISEREELWIPRAAIIPTDNTIERLLSSGIFAIDEVGLRIGFTHQSFFEFARARAFVRSESLTQYATAHQNSLFVRPAIWTALRYLREADATRYRKEIFGLWQSALRPHLRLLLIEFLGQLSDPRDEEEGLLFPLLADTKWAALACQAISRSAGWFARVRKGLLQSLMCGDRPGLAYPVLIENLKNDRDVVLDSIDQCWAGRRARADILLSVLLQLNSWNERARDIAEQALSLYEERPSALESLAWHLKDKAPEFAIHFIANQLVREFREISKNLPCSPTLSKHASTEEQVEWYLDREPRKALDDVLHSAATISVLIDLARAAPLVFLVRMLPWLASVLDGAATCDEWHTNYRSDFLLDYRHSGRVVNELPHAFRAASELLAGSNPRNFMAVFHEWAKSDILSIHVILSYGLEKIATTHARDVYEYLIGDSRRLSLADCNFEADRTVAIMKSVAGTLNSEEIRALERAILNTHPSSESIERPLEARQAARQINRRHRLRLLCALPREHLTLPTGAIVDQELRVFDLDSSSTSSFELQVIGSSPFKVAAM